MNTTGPKHRSSSKAETAKTTCHNGTFTALIYIEQTAAFLKQCQNSHYNET